jgi:hypothetical protein
MNADYLEVIGRDHNIRHDWWTVGKDIHHDLC